MYVYYVVGDTEPASRVTFTVGINGKPSTGSEPEVGGWPDPSWSHLCVSAEICFPVSQGFLLLAGLLC
jgi:hypothetical protein